MQASAILAVRILPNFYPITDYYHGEIFSNQAKFSLHFYEEQSDLSSSDYLPLKKSDCACLFYNIFVI